jgi:site-specific DNA-cytosine methylase
MRVLSLFDGCGMFYQALKDSEIEVSDYYASEIDKFAIKIALKNHPHIVQVGDITSLDDDKLASLGDIDLLCAGFPCTSLSIAARQKESGLEKGQSTLFYEALRVIKTVKPKYFLVENVASMKNADRDKISEALGVEPIMINSALLTAQSRKRYYWTNIPNVSQPEDKGILLKDILESGFTDRSKSFCLTATYHKAGANDYFLFGNRQLVLTESVEVKIDRSLSLAEQKKFVLTELKPKARKLSTVECEKLQGLPGAYTEGVSETQRYKMIGNGFTVPVISHILKNLC